jgi:small subunit ribosomal protein S1
MGMLSGRDEAKPENDFLELDEGWWASVLADEDAFRLHEKSRQTKNHAKQREMDVDWECIQSLHERDEIVELEVHSYNRGGLLVQGKQIKGFVPISHLVDLPNCADKDERNVVLNEYLGRSVHLKVIECDPLQERVVLSERAALAGEGCRKQLLKRLKPRDVICGTVTNVTDFGVFVDLGGVEGLVHVSELSWGRVQHPNEVLHEGQNIETIVLHVSEENERVALSYKQLFPNPWDSIMEFYQPGDTVSAVITSVKSFGAFARLEEGIEGLIHISSIAFKDGQGEVEDVLLSGQSVSAKVLHIDAERRRLGLSLVECE